MRISAILLLGVFVGLACGLTACGTECSDVCRYAVLCSDEYPVLWADCNNYCNYYSDCATFCNPNESTCNSFYNCVMIECNGEYFPAL